jgi:hypothetical protein
MLVTPANAGVQGPEETLGKTVHPQVGSQ